MSSSLDFLNYLSELGIHVTLNGDDLLLNARRGAITPQLQADLVTRKPELLRLLRSAKSEKSLSAPASILSKSPLSQAQLRIWFLSQLDPAGSAWNVASVLHLHGSLHENALSRALSEIVSRHSILRYTFHSTDGIPQASILPASHWSLTSSSFPDVGAARAAAHVAALQRFELAEVMPFRAVLCSAPCDEYFLVIAAHHIACDGWSLGVLVKELSALYQAFSAGAGSPLPPPSYQYSDYVAWEGQQPLETTRADLAWWKERLSPPLPLVQLLPNDLGPTPVPQASRRLTNYLPASRVTELQTFARVHQVTIFMVLLAAFKLLIFRYTGLEDILVGTVSSYRKRKEFEPLIGMFANPVLLRTSLSADLSFLALLDLVRTTVTSSFAHDNVPFNQIVESVRPDRHGLHQPLYQVSFTYQNLPIPELQWKGVTISLERPETCGARNDLSIEVWQTADGLALDWEFNTALLDAFNIQQLQQSYSQLLASILASSTSPLAALGLLTSSEKHRLIGTWNGSATEYPSLPIQSLFEEQRRMRPDAIALVQGSTTFTYDQLGAVSDCISARLKFAGVNAGDPVAILVPRSITSIQAMLGVLKIGACYVPIDPTYPRRRIEEMLLDAGVTSILTYSNSDSDWLFDRPEFVCLDVIDAASPNHELESSRSVSGAALDDLLCILYTSGSKGKPKGVEMSHRGLVRLLFSKELSSYGEQTNCLHLAAQTFDASLLEIWGPLVHGGTIIVDPDPRPDPRNIGHLLRLHNISAAWLTSSLFNWIVSDAPSILAPLRTIYIGGEALSIKHVRHAQQQLPNLQFINGYGPTEATVFTCLYRIPSPLPDHLTSVPIGKPVSNTSVYVLDKQQQLVPVGVRGELYIGGDALARGYRNDADLTVKHFIPDRITGKGRLYRSGDVVEWLRDGNLHFIGRADDQVKVRGHRVELGEIEAATSEYPGVISAAAIADRSAVSGDRIIVWYSTEYAVSSKDLLNALTVRLPQYMLPNLLRHIDAMPLLPSGKVDRRALDQAPLIENAITPPQDQAPAPDLVYLIAEVMADLLGLPQVEPDGDFFVLGGHSLLALQLSSRLAALLGRHISPALLFQASTSVSIAQLLAEQHVVRPHGLLAIRPAGTLPALFCVHLLTDGSIQQYLSLVRSLDRSLPIYAICPVEIPYQTNPFVSVGDQASAHSLQIRNALPGGSYQICGYSSGGILAFEIARQLHSQGEDVTLILIDSFPPGTLRRIATHDSWKIIKLLLHPFAWRHIRARLIRLAVIAKTTVMGGLRRLHPSFSPQQPTSEDLLAKALVDSMKRYTPSVYLGPAVLFRSQNSEGINLFNFDGYNNWSRFIPNGIRLASIPGDHLEIMKPPSVKALARHLFGILSRSEDGLRVRPHL